MGHAAFLARHRGLPPSFNQVGGKLRVTIMGRPDLGHAEHELRDGSFAATVAPTLAGVRGRGETPSLPVTASAALPARSGALREILIGVVVGVLVVFIVRSV